jgi:hypothetical protein
LPDNKPDKPEYVTVTCPTCHERIGVRLTIQPQTINCTFCEVPIPVPSQEQARVQRALNSPFPTPTVEEYAIAARDEAPHRKTFRSKSARPGTDPPAEFNLSLECPTCHELVKATAGEVASSAPCPFCAAPLTIPDRQTVAGWRKKNVEPLARERIGEYEAGAVLATKSLRPGNVFDRLAEVRQEIVPDPPRWTFFSSVFSVPWRGEAFIRWLYQSVGFAILLLIIVETLGLYGSMFGTTHNGIILILVGISLFWIGLWTASYSAACGVAVLESTGSGLDKIEGWPEPNWKEWMIDLIYLSWIGAIPLSLSYGLMRLTELWGPRLLWVWPVGFFVMYPISMLSALEANSIWVPLTLPILASLGRWWWAWGLFYLVTGLTLGALAAFMGFALASSHAYVVILLAPLVPAVWLIYCRLLGRLAWRMTSQPPTQRRATQR